MHSKRLSSIFLILTFVTAIGFLEIHKPVRLVKPVKAQTEIDQVFAATVKLYLLNPAVLEKGTDPTPMGVCMAWAASKTENGYLLVTAGHCIDLEGINANRKGLFGVAIGEPSPHPDLVPAVILYEGTPNDEKDDIAVLQIATKTELPVLPLGDETKLNNAEPVFVVAAPLKGDIKAVFQGYVAQKKTSPVGETYDNLPVYSLPGAISGSSGAAVWSIKQNKVVGLLNLTDYRLMESTGTVASRITEDLTHIKSLSPTGFDLSLELARQKAAE